MSDVDDRLTRELKKLPAKPADNAKQSEKKRYSELMSSAVARALAQALRRKGLAGALPLVPEDSPQASRTMVNDHGENEEDSR